MARFVLQVMVFSPFDEAFVLLVWMCEKTSSVRLISAFKVVRVCPILGVVLDW